MMSAQVIPFPVEKRAPVRVVDPREAWLVGCRVVVISGPFIGRAGMVTRLSATNTGALMVALDHEWFPTHSTERLILLAHLMIEAGEHA
jgi:transcription antitermination factor NusG